jgi:hypothetical protein
MDHPILRAHASLDPHSKYHFFEETIIHFFRKVPKRNRNYVVLVNQNWIIMNVVIKNE